MKQAPELARKSWPGMTRNLQRTIASDKFRAGSSPFGMLIKESNQGLHRAGFYRGVWIKQQNVFPRASLNGMIVRAREPQVFMIFDEVHLSELLAHPPGTLISG